MNQYQISNIKNIFKFCFIVLVFGFYFLLLFSNKVFAADYKVDYLAQYFLSENSDDLDTQVQLTIQITNLRSDIYVNKFAISFPKSFSVSNLKAFDDNGKITPNITSDDYKTKIELEFSRPNTGKNSVNTFNLQFNQDKLFEINGNIWEVILPTIEKKSFQSDDSQAETNYRIIVNLPRETNKKISIAKPKPTLISGNQIIWDNPRTKTVYAVFGDYQIYNLTLNYHLKNSGILPVYTDVAFPPDRLYQKIIIDSIVPKPVLTYTDEDGNFLGRYFLKPKETLQIIFKGKAKITAKYREEVISGIRAYFSTQSKYLLSEQNYWEAPSVSFDDRSPDGIYRYVVNTLRYDYQRLNKQAKRLGALEAVKQPDKAVCVEFSDLFIALARENGIYSREVQGYAFTRDPQLRPLSLATDILHSWPEYYDQDKSLWIEIDPTWENTSGIDYFNSFDLNHIAFVIHGRRSDYPLPAGMYKIENSRDISVLPTKDEPNEKKQIEVDVKSLPTQISDNQTVKTKISIINNGNVFIWNLPVVINSDELNIIKDKYHIISLAPYEKKDFDFSITSKKKNKKLNAQFEILIDGQKKLTKSIIVVPFIYTLIIRISQITIIIIFLFFIGKLIVSHLHGSR